MKELLFPVRAGLRKPIFPRFRNAPAIRNQSSSRRSSSRMFGGSGFFLDEASRPVPIVPIPDLPVLNNIVNVVKTNPQSFPDFSKVGLIGVQHFLESTTSLVKSIIDLGVKPENIMLAPKCYSRCPQVEVAIKNLGVRVVEPVETAFPGGYQHAAKKTATKVWDTFSRKNPDLQKLIVLDEGFRLLENIPRHIGPSQYEIAAIEQTRGGLYSEFAKALPFPVIEVASAAAKKILEPSLIASTCISELNKLRVDFNLEDKSRIFGILGNGAIGKAGAQYLLSLGHKVLVYDPNEGSFENISDRNFYRMPNAESVIAGADVVLGCTGLDVTKDIKVLDLVTKDTLFVSLSSEDKEFLSILKSIKDLPYRINDSTISVQLNSGSTIKIANEGYPIGFNRSPVSVPTQQIQLTRGLLLMAFLQACLKARQLVGDGRTLNNVEKLSLDPYLQRFVVQCWKPFQLPNDPRKEFIDNFEDIEWVKKQSGGDYDDKNLHFKQLFELSRIRTVNLDSDDISRIYTESMDLIAATPTPRSLVHKN